MKGLSILLFCLAGFSASAATYYVDSAVSSSGNGLSWATAWKNLSNITGVSGGDIVYMQGSFSTSQWLIIGSGNSTNPVIYRVGQDAGHDSLVTFNLSGNPGLVPNSGSTVTGVWIDGNLGGQRKFQWTGTFLAAGSHNIDGLRMSYITFTNQPGESGVVSMNKFEFDHNWVQTEKDCNNFFYTASGGWGPESPDSNLIHDNTFLVYGGDNGFGDDVWQWISHVSFYSNTMVRVYSAGGSGVYRNHQDFIQANPSNSRFYDNYFEGSSQYHILFENCGSDVEIFNNVFRNSGAVGAVDLALGAWLCSSTNIIIANNTFDGTAGGRAGITLGNTGTNARPFYGVMVNNILYNSAVEKYPDGGTIGDSNNYSGTAITFVNRAAYPNNNYRIASDSGNHVIDQGVSPGYITSIFTTDADGYTRTGNGSAWDLGAYEYGASGGDATAPTLSTATIGTSGTTITLAFDETVSVGSGGSGGWALTMSGGSAITLTYSSGSGSSSLVYSLSSTVNSGETVSSGLNYTQPGDGIEDSAGNDLANVSSHAVTNNSSQGGAAAAGVWSITTFKSQ